MKRILSIILCVCMLFGMVNVVFAEEKAASEKVEISFRVGESTLMINSVPVEVETPYIAGEGTTLVPLRVITEAFGAKVTWVDATKEIILEYPDVNITLQIGNTTATVNTHTEQLPVAPVLSPNGVTMVPLRFISETFGATVGYDDATKAITVVKEAEEENSTISSSTDLPRIGDSYWGWSMMTPGFMMMTDRRGDGRSTTFEDGDNALYIDVFDFSDVEDVEEDELFELNYEDVKSEYFYDLTLSRDTKGTDSLGNKTFRLTGRNKAEYIDYYAVLQGDKSLEILFITVPGNEQIATMESILDSFKAQFAGSEEEKAQTYDLSNVGEDGYRIVEDEELGVSFKVPAFYDEDYDDIINIMCYYYEQYSITLGVYSITDECTAQKEADLDCRFYQDYVNKNIFTVSDIMNYEAAGESAVYYTVSTEGLSTGDYDGYDVFFEKGDYVYNITVISPKDEGAIFKTVMDSLKIDEIDSSAVGTLLREHRAEGKAKELSTKDWTLTMTDAWSEYGSRGNSVLYLNNNTSTMMAVTVTSFNDTQYTSAREATNGMFAVYQQLGEVSQKVTGKKLGTRTFYSFTIELADEETGEVSMYYTAYIAEIGRNLYCFELYETEKYAFSKTREELETALSGFVVK